MDVSASDITNWAAIAGVVVPLAALSVSAWRYVGIRKADQRQREFENYHRLIRDLSTGGEAVRLPAQTAIIYELRNFPRYRSVSVRVLRALQKDWDAEGKRRHIEEIDLTIAYLDKFKEPR